MSIADVFQDLSTGQADVLRSILEEGLTEEQYRQSFVRASDKFGWQAFQRLMNDRKAERETEMASPDALSYLESLIGKASGKTGLVPLVTAASVALIGAQAGPVSRSIVALKASMGMVGPKPAIAGVEADLTVAEVTAEAF